MRSKPCVNRNESFQDVRNQGGVRMEDVAPAGGGPHAAPRDAPLIPLVLRRHASSLRWINATSCARHNCAREIAARASPRGCNIFCKSRHLTGFSFSTGWHRPCVGRAVVSTGENRQQRGGQHMMREHRSLIVWPSLIAAGLLAAACTDQPK